MSELVHDARRRLPLWPALPGRREPDLDRVAGHLRNALEVRAAVVSLVSAAGQVIPGAGGRWDAGRSLPHAWPLCSEVVRTARPLLVDDVRSWTAPAGEFGPVVPWLRGYAGVPLTDRTGRVVGAVSGLVDRPRRWVRKDVDVLEETAQLCRGLVGLRTAQIALEQCVAEASWARERARAAVRRSENDLARATAEHARHQMLSAAADALAEVAGTASDAGEICASVGPVLATHLGVARVRWAVTADEEIWKASQSVRLPVVPQIAEPGALVLEWSGRSQLQADDRDALHRVAVLVGQALDRMHLVRRWERLAREVIEPRHTADRIRVGRRAGRRPPS
jgi:hypothetical protein